MRIVGGTFRGRRLAALGKGDAGAHLRPTSDRVRESLFSMLEGGRFGDPIDGARVLDLFAGTGALGLEALSRGAAQVTFVDDGRVAQKLLAENIASLGLRDVTRVIRASALRLPPAEYAAQLIFLDPPYGKDLGPKALAAARAQGWIAPDALIVWEERGPQDPPEGFTLLEHKTYGDTVMTLLRG
ncbi:16S rRNA (guanine966-N2)-methyltransferase [Pseudooceanicola nitratireducens]|jgi:16S rRNA (guanine966-N2)-methyltransferase|uniref:16S rRNA (Guanine966-N2)-methyltransferase n=1 Tax=Pseudooceanicola nitratireducens TaxID=517719 RepID=A0A1I1I4D8_9RHOB|nr:16S rRNA (guanine(966)-N(2))-methyltransferase RsmD [Pseudooceanicola nitratireducens]SEJ19012.1 16S rRNA (guanine966-N2)-methyltransferase [Pseudooceanicola nitratireducens]SFC31299.1 16S rRNA (guanine966-N2)-methyltransferase [Pseudooceanicola nitratireducens]